MTQQVNLGKQATGVPGLDTLLDGGLSEFSFNVISGPPGSGKTTLAHQIMFALASPQRRALFFTVLGEPPLKMLRFQQQYTFFDINKVGDCVRYVNLAEDLRTGDFSGVLERIRREVEEFAPGMVFVDSFRSVIQTARSGNEGVADLQHFVQELGNHMTSWQAMTFLIGEYASAESEVNPIMTVADGMFLLSHDMVNNAVVRKLRIVKMRGQAHMEGAHTFRMTHAGLHIYPRQLPPLAVDKTGNQDPQRITTGVAELDALFYGGIPQGHAVLVVGPSGSGKTVLGMQFLAEGVRLGETGVLASFEKGAGRLRNGPLANMVQAGTVAVVEGRALDLSVEEVLDELVCKIAQTGAKRVLIDSLSEFGLYLASEFRHEFRESVFRILTTLARLDVTVMVTMGQEDRYTDLRFSQADSSFLVDAIVAMRYVETEGRLAKLISVVKVRGCAHSTELRQYQIGDAGLEIGATPMRFDGLLSSHLSTPPMA